MSNESGYIMFTIELIKGTILGVIGGLTEFAPVSSAGRMILVDDMQLKSSEFLDSRSALTFKIVIQLGSVFVAAWVFHERFLEILHIGKHKHIGGDSDQQRRSKPRRLNLLHVLAGMMPAGISGLLFGDFIEGHLFSVPTIMTGLFIDATYMTIAGKYSAKVKNPQAVDQISYFRAFVIGTSQTVAMWPSLSRSSSTISTGVSMKLNHKAASDFTFIMAVPIMSATNGLSLLKHYQGIQIADIPFYILGFLATFTVGLIAIKTFLHLTDEIKLVPFAVYRIVLVTFITILYFRLGIGKGI